MNRSAATILRSVVRDRSIKLSHMTIWGCINGALRTIAPLLCAALSPCEGNESRQTTCFGSSSIRVAIAAKCLRYAWRHTATGLRTDQTVPELPKAKLGNSTRSSRRGGSAIRSRCRRWSTQRHALVGQRLNGLQDVQGVAPESVELPHDHGVAGAGLVHQGGQAGAVVACPGHHVGERLHHARGLERRVLLVEGLQHGADAGVPDAPPPAG